MDRYCTGSYWACVRRELKSVGRDLTWSVVHRLLIGRRRHKQNLLVMPVTIKKKTRPIDEVIGENAASLRMKQKESVNDHWCQPVPGGPCDVMTKFVDKESVVLFEGSLNHAYLLPTLPEDKLELWPSVAT